MQLFSDERNNTRLLGVLADHRSYIFRGQRDPNWELTPSLNRLLAEKIKRDIYELGGGTDIDSKSLLSGFGNMDSSVESHRNNFERAIRGRIDITTLNSLLSNDTELWAVGQHHGLGSPLLDWTTSPFVAAFFAFEEKSGDGEEKRIKNKENQTSLSQEMRVVYALDKEALKNCSSYDVAIVEPQFGENPRMIAQGGLFTFIPPGVDLEWLVKKQFKNSTNYVLIKIYIPASDRHGVLKLLNRFNINHLSLFPDIIGASKYCNINFEIDNY